MTIPRFTCPPPPLRGPMPRFQQQQQVPKGVPERRLSYREQQQQHIQQLMQQHVQSLSAATPERIAKLEEDAKKFAQGSKF